MWSEGTAALVGGCADGGVAGGAGVFAGVVLGVVCVTDVSAGGLLITGVGGIVTFFDTCGVVVTGVFCGVFLRDTGGAVTGVGPGCCDCWGFGGTPCGVLVCVVAEGTTAVFGVAGGTVADIVVRAGI